MASLRARPWRRSGAASRPRPSRIRRGKAARRALPYLSFAAAVAVLASGCSGAPTRPDQTVLTISGGICGRGWLHPHTGLQTFQLHNVSSGVAEVYLINPEGGNLDPDSVSAPVFAEVEGLGPGTTAPMQVNVGSGAYAFECELEHYGPIVGPIVRISGNVRGTPGVLSVTYDTLARLSGELARLASQYRAYVAAGPG